MIPRIRRRRIYLRIISFVIACLFLLNNITWADTETATLSPQHMFDPIKDEALQDIGFLKAAFKYNLLKDENFLNNSNNKAIKIENNPVFRTVEFKFAKKEMVRERGCLVPCVINRSKTYYAYITQSPKNPDRFSITIYTQADYDSGAKIKHRKGHYKKVDAQTMASIRAGVVEAGDITIADIGLDAPEHEAVINKNIRELTVRGNEVVEVEGLEGFDIYVIGDKSDMFIDESSSQRAHAGGISTVGSKDGVKRLWIARGYYDQQHDQAINRLRHEAVELNLWCERTQQLLMRREIRAPDDLSSTLPTIREWIAQNIELARTLQAQYHMEAETQYASAGTTPLEELAIQLQIVNDSYQQAFAAYTRQDERTYIEWREIFQQTLRSAYPLLENAVRQRSGGDFVERTDPVIFHLCQEIAGLPICTVEGGYIFQAMDLTRWYGAPRGFDESQDRIMRQETHRLLEILWPEESADAIDRYAERLIARISPLTMDYFIPAGIAADQEELDRGVAGFHNIIQAFAACDFERLSIEINPSISLERMRLVLSEELMHLLHYIEYHNGKIGTGLSPEVIGNLYQRLRMREAGIDFTAVVSAGEGRDWAERRERAFEIGRTIGGQAALKDRRAEALGKAISNMLKAEGASEDRDLLDRLLGDGVAGIIVSLYGDDHTRIWNHFREILKGGLLLEEIDITISDIGLDAPEHEAVINKNIREMTARGNEAIEVEGLKGFEIHVIGNNEDMFIDADSGQRAHAGGISTVGSKSEVKRLWIARGYYDQERDQAIQRLRHEAVELGLWWQKAGDLLAGKQIRAYDDATNKAPVMRGWIARNIQEARMLQGQYHKKAEDEYPVMQIPEDIVSGSGALVGAIKTIIQQRFPQCSVDGLEFEVQYSKEYKSFNIRSKDRSINIYMTLASSGAVNIDWISVSDSLLISLGVDHKSPEDYRLANVIYSECIEPFLAMHGVTTVTACKSCNEWNDGYRDPKYSNLGFRLVRPANLNVHWDVEVSDEYEKDISYMTRRSLPRSAKRPDIMSEAAGPSITGSTIGLDSGSRTEPDVEAVKDAKIKARRELVLKEMPKELHYGHSGIFDVPMVLRADEKTPCPIDKLDQWLRESVFPNWDGDFYFVTSCEDSEPSDDAYLMSMGFVEVAREQLGYSFGPVVFVLYMKTINGPDTSANIMPKECINAINHVPGGLYARYHPEDAALKVHSWSEHCPVEALDQWLRDWIYPQYRGRIQFYTSNVDKYGPYLLKEGFREVDRKEDDPDKTGNVTVSVTYEKIIGGAPTNDSNGKKCIVLDCDGVLWGGVAGEDGVSGIVLNEHYLAFQRKLVELRNSGFILVLNSRNNIADVRNVFTAHPEMPLKWSDFASSRINWQDKASNIRELAAELNIGADSMVFLDDMPQERSLVASLVPEVVTPELPQDPAGYVALLEGLAVLKPKGAVTEEDRIRTELYGTKQKRDELARRTMSREEYLDSLQIKVAIREASEEDIPRVAQLTQRTNQFNLTTRRYTEDEIRRLRRDGNYQIYVLKYSDVFGDAGTVALMILKKTGEGAMEVDTFCQSCRILNLGVEFAFMEYVAEKLKGGGCGYLHGTYIPTQRNTVVKDIYGRMGFSLVKTAPSGQTEWALDLQGSSLEGSEWVKISADERAPGDKTPSDVTAGDIGLKVGEDQEIAIQRIRELREKGDEIVQVEGMEGFEIHVIGDDSDIFIDRTKDRHVYASGLASVLEGNKTIRLWIAKGFFEQDHEIALNGLAREMYNIMLWDRWVNNNLMGKIKERQYRFSLVDPLGLKQANLPTLREWIVNNQKELQKTWSYFNLRYTAIVGATEDASTVLRRLFLTYRRYGVDIDVIGTTIGEIRRKCRDLHKLKSFYDALTALISSMEKNNMQRSVRLVIVHGLGNLIFMGRNAANILGMLDKAREFTDQGLNPYYFTRAIFGFPGDSWKSLTAGEVKAISEKVLAGLDERSKFVLMHRPLNLDFGSACNESGNFDESFLMAESEHNGPSLEELDEWFENYVFPYYRGELYFVTACDDPVVYDLYLKEKGFISIGREEHSTSGGDMRVLELYKKTVNGKKSLPAFDESRDAKGSIANCIRDLHRSDHPKTVEQLMQIRGRSETTVRKELEALSAMGLLKQEGRGVKGDPYIFSLHSMLKGLSSQQIEKICDIEIMINGRPVKILGRYEIPVQLIPVVQANVNEMIQSMIHEENLDLTPAISQGKTLWHVVVNELIPNAQQDMGLVTQMNQMSKRSGYSEKIRILTKKDKLEEVLAELLRDPNNIIHVALNDEKKVSQMPKGVKMAVFKGQMGNFVQLEGMMAVSRALLIEDPAVRNDKLRRLYKLLTGEEFSGSLPVTDDPRELALSIIFNLPKIIITDYNELKRLNNVLKMLIQSA